MTARPIAICPTRLNLARKLWRFFFFAATTLLLTRGSYATGIECIIKPDAQRIPIASLANKRPLGTLGPGDYIYTFCSIAWCPPNQIIRNGSIIAIEHQMPPEALNCAAPKTDEYPLVIQAGSQESIALAEEFGIVRGSALNGQRISGSFVKCGSISKDDLDLRKDVVDSYRRQGFSLPQICLAFSIGMIIFDPETGKRLPTYVIQDGDEVSAQYPLVVPPCFARGRSTVLSAMHIAEMKPLGCNIRYHPWSGRLLNNEERRALSADGGSMGYAIIKGPDSDDGDKVINVASRRASIAKLKLIKLELNGSSSQPAPAGRGSLVDDLARGTWAVGNRSTCSQAAGVYSLTTDGGQTITWKSGSGNIDEETIVSIRDNEMSTSTKRSMRTKGQPVVIGKRWTYRRLGPDQIEVLPDGGKAFTLVRC